MLYIATTVKDTDDADLPLVVINKIINDVIIHRKESHSHGCPRVPFHSCVPFGKDVKGADGLTDPFCLAFGILGSELFES